MTRTTRTDGETKKYDELRNAESWILQGFLEPSDDSAHVPGQMSQYMQNTVGGQEEAGRVSAATALQSVIPWNPQIQIHQIVLILK